jgi:glycosyltransferase involved in cell wall biosynthesis
VVDDASTDRTAEVAREAGAKVISHLENRGSGASRKTGIRHAEGDIIIFLDADGTYPAKSIPELIKHFPQYDQVIGARKVEMGTLKLLRKPAKWFIGKLASFLSGKKIPDLNSGMRAFKKDIMMKYLFLIPDGFSCVSTMTLVFLVNGYNVKFVPIDYYKRVGKSKFHPIKDTYNYILTVIRMITHFNPLKVFLPISLFLFIFGMAKGLYSRFYLVGRLQASDIIILTTSVIVASIGLLADLIASLLKRP